MSFVPARRRVRLDIPEDRRVRHRSPRVVAGQDRRQVEPKAVDVHLLDPVPQTVHDHPADDRLVSIQSIPATGIVGVSRAALFEDVVSRVVDPAKTERRPRVIALGGVVEHHVEDDLDARPVEGFHHVSELIDGAERVTTRAIGRVRREEGHGLITPVVHQAWRASLWVERKYRQQLHGGDPESFQIGNLLDQPGERAAGSSRRPRNYGWLVNPRTCIS